MEEKSQNLSWTVQSRFKSLCKNGNRTLKPIFSPSKHFLSFSLLELLSFCLSYTHKDEEGPCRGVHGWQMKWEGYSCWWDNRSKPGNRREPQGQVGVLATTVYIKKMVSVSLLATHTHWDAYTPHAQKKTSSCLSVFGVDVSLNKRHQSSSSGVFTFVLRRGTTPDLTASLPCSHRACLKALKVG